jgi:RNA recognition motif-containing protein
MSKRIYVGNLPFSIALDKLKELFSQYGEIEDATIVTNKFSGRSKGFGFVEFKEDSAADAAISEMNNKNVEGREIVVKEAMPFDPDKPRKKFGRGPRRERQDESEGGTTAEESFEE